MPLYNPFKVTDEKPPRSQALVFILIAAFLWSTSGLFIKLLPYHPLVIGSLRASVMLVALLIYRRGHKVTWNRANVVVGITMALTVIFFITANKLTTSANAIVLQYTAPIFTMMYSWIFFRLKARRRDVIAVVCTVIGMSLFFFDSLEPGNIIGNVLAILSGMCMAWQNIHFSNLEGSPYDGLIISQIFLVASGIPFLFLAPPALTVQSVAIIVYMGIFQQMISHIFFVVGMKSATPLDGALLTTLEPLLNPVWVFVVLGETPSLICLIGAAVVLVSISVWCIMNARIQTISEQNN